MTSRSAQIRIGELSLAGELSLPPDARGVVAFAHGSGSSRHSPRNQQVAAALRQAGLATLLFDLLTAEEEQRDALDASLRFDIGLLAERLTGAVDGLASSPETAKLPIGLFGASTGAAAALVCAAARPGLVRSVVSRGGRPDLAGDALPAVRAATLLLVGEGDEQVIALNRQAAERLGGPYELTIVPRATHLFPEPGALEEVSRRAADWFTVTLGEPAPARPAGRPGQGRGGAFADRAEAGRYLGEQLRGRADLTDPVVLGLPRGGVPIAAEVADVLGAELDVLLVRKLGLPWHPELAMGAIAAVDSSVQTIRNEPVLAVHDVSEAAFDQVREQETAELRRREREYRGDAPPASVTGRTVILVDDGLATGSTMLAAAAAVAARAPAKVLVAVPVGAAETCRRLTEHADEVVCAWTPEPFFAVGQAYDDFSATSDEEVRRLLADRQPARSD